MRVNYEDEKKERRPRTKLAATLRNKRLSAQEKKKISSAGTKLQAATRKLVAQPGLKVTPKLGGFGMIGKAISAALGIKGFSGGAAAATGAMGLKRTKRGGEVYGSGR
jgi:hypothetical protein